MIFVDTGAFLGLYIKRDQNHKPAVEAWRDMALPLVTSNLVLAELGTLLVREIGGIEASERLLNVYQSISFKIVESSRTDEMTALRWMRKYADQAVSFTDCVSFAMMHRLKIRTAFTFDRHFRLAGFDVIGLKSPVMGQ